MNSTSSRRAFLQQTTRSSLTLSATTAALGGVRASGADNPAKLHLGIIGCGGIMTHHVKGLVERRETVSIAWLCDVDPAQTERIDRLITRTFQAAPPKRTDRSPGRTIYRLRRSQSDAHKRISRPVSFAGGLMMPRHLPSTAHPRRFSLFLIAVILITVIAQADDPPTSIPVHNPQRLAGAAISCERIALGEPEDYKPCIARLPNGELLLTAFHQYRRDDNQVMEQTLLFRSKDGGRTWSQAEKLKLLGREPYLTVLPDGTIFITGHLLAQDVRNEWGYTCGFLHRSIDGGRSWQSIRIESESVQPRKSNHTTRNVLRLADGTLLLGVDYDGGDGPWLMWRSKDNGATWDKTATCEPRDFKSVYGFFGGETWLWQSRSSRIWALVRVDSNELPISNKPIAAQNDQADHFILFSSSDDGKTFDRIRDFGDYGEMYMSLLRLHDRRLLLTFTVRDLSPPLGVRALLGTETEDGFQFDFTKDRLMLDTRTPVGKYQGGGFGPTVQLEDGTLVTSYSYRGDDDKTHLEVVRWKPPQW